MNLEFKLKFQFSLLNSKTSHDQNLESSPHKERYHHRIDDLIRNHQISMASTWKSLNHYFPPRRKYSFRPPLLHGQSVPWVVAPTGRIPTIIRKPQEVRLLRPLSQQKISHIMGHTHTANFLLPSPSKSEGGGGGKNV